MLEKIGIGFVIAFAMVGAATIGVVLAIAFQEAICSIA